MLAKPKFLCRVCGIVCLCNSTQDIINKKKLCSLHRDVEDVDKAKEEFEKGNPFKNTSKDFSNPANLRRKKPTKRRKEHFNRLPTYKCSECDKETYVKRDKCMYCNTSDSLNFIGYKKETL